MSQAAEIAGITDAFTAATGVNASQTTVVFFALIFGILLSFSLSIVFKKSDEVRRTENYKDLGLALIISIAGILLVLVYSIFVTVG